MIVRLALNATAHMVAGFAVGVLAYVLVKQQRELSELRQIAQKPAPE